MEVKKTILLGFISLIWGTAIYGASLQWGTADNTYIYDENGALLNPCSSLSAADGDAVYLYQDVDCDGSDPLTSNDDDVLLDESFIGEGNFCLNAGQFSAITDIAVGTYCLFVRAFNDPDPLNATYYGDSQVQTITVSEPDDTLTMFTETFTTTTPVPTAVFMKDLYAVYHDSAVHIYWSTGYEVNTMSFKIVRFDGANEKGITISTIPAKLSPFGWSYSFVDKDVIEGKTYIYYIVEVEFGGRETRYGPISVFIPISDGLKIRNEGNSYIVSVKLPDYKLINKNRVVKVELPGWDNLPVSNYILPLKTIHIGIPEGYYTLRIKSYTYKDVELNRDLTKMECPPLPEIPGVNILQKKCEEKTPLKGEDGFSPKKPVEVVGDYLLRNQRILKINIYPVRIDRTTLRIAESIEFEVIIHSDASASNVEDNLETIYSFLNNYSEAKKYRIKLGKKSELTRELPSKYLKISCEDKGMLKIPLSAIKETLLTNEFMIEYEGRNWRYYNDGKNVILYLPRYKSYYTEDNTAFIFAGPTYIAPLLYSPSPSDTQLSEFTETLRIDTDNYLLPAIPVGDEGELWFMQILDQPTNSVNFSIPYPSSSSGTIRLKLFSYVDTVPSTYHHIIIYFNGNYSCEATWTGMKWKEITCDVDNILTGENTLQLDILSDGGINYDMILLDEIEVIYKREFKTDDEQISFELPSGGNVSICCFSEIPVIAKISDEGIEKIVGGKVSQIQGTFTIDAYLEKGKYIAGVPVNNCSTELRTLLLPSDEEGYDMIIIGDITFKDTIQRLITRREREGLSIVFIDIKDLYDTYSDGRKDPEAIKRFIKEAYSTWDKKPSYVLLLGDGSYDPRNIIFNGNDLIPVKFLQTDYLAYHSPSDTYLAAVSGEDIVPDVAIGRIPAETVSELEKVIDKIEVFEDTIDHGATPLSVLFVADRDDLGIFEESIKRLKELYPQDFEEISLKWREFNGDKTAIVGRINSEVKKGVLFFNYSGHGSIDSWGKDLFFTNDDLSTLTNSFPLILLPQTCMNGYFVVPILKSFGETAILHKEGAVSAWVSSGFTYPGSQLALMQAFTKAIFVKNCSRIGDALLYALGSIDGVEGWEDVVKTWIFMGDPSMRLTPIQIPSPTISQLNQNSTDKENNVGGETEFRDKGVLSCSHENGGYSFIILLLIPFLIGLKKKITASL